ncbi:transposable element Tcb1 transposase [Trichonephila clavipes]|nr:transposable element Tcb1 transposase [Trichonephila clavipes]
MAVTNHSITSRTIEQHIESVTHHSESARTIRRRSQQSGLSARRPLLGLLLSQSHKRLRHQWCDERRMWVAECNEVVFTNEPHLSATRRWLNSSLETPWRDDAEQLRYAPPHWSCTGYYGMEWNWISLSHSSSTHCRYFKQPALHLTEVLEPVILPYLQGLVTAIFQQDNARPHEARIVQMFFVNRQID